MGEEGDEGHGKIARLIADLSDQAPDDSLNFGAADHRDMRNLLAASMQTFPTHPKSWPTVYLRSTGRRPI